MKCSECNRAIVAEELPGRYAEITYLFDFKMSSDIAKEVGDDWVGIIHDGLTLCRKCLHTYRFPGITKKT